MATGVVGLMVGHRIEDYQTLRSNLMRCSIMKNRTELLDEIGQILADRGSVYGSSRSNHERISELWTAYYGSYISPMQVALMQLLVKVSRLAESENHEDSVKDIIGYAIIYRELFEQYENEYGVADGI